MEAVDRFSQFFISPLFDEDALEREVKAVDSEHSKNFLRDARRESQIIKWLSDQRHAYTGEVKELFQNVSKVPWRNILKYWRHLPRITFIDFYNLFSTFSVQSSQLATKTPWRKRIFET